MKDNKAITVLVGIATLAFGWVIYPFLGAVFWAVVIAIVFYPLYKWILARHIRPLKFRFICHLVPCLFDRDYSVTGRLFGGHQGGFDVDHNDPSR